MPKFTAIVYVARNCPELKATLQSLQIADDILVIMEDPQCDIAQVARKHHARIKGVIPGVTAGAYAMDAFYDWLMVVRSNEQISTELREALSAWRKKKHDEGTAYRVRIPDGCTQTRIVNRRKLNWTGELPPDQPNAETLPGALELLGS